MNQRAQGACSLVRTAARQQCVPGASGDDGRKIKEQESEPASALQATSSCAPAAIAWLADLAHGVGASFRAAMRCVDRLVSIDGRSVFGTSLLKAAQLLEGRERSVVSVEVQEPKVLSLGSFCTLIKMLLCPPKDVACQCLQQQRLLPCVSSCCVWYSHCASICGVLWSKGRSIRARFMMHS